MQTNAVEMELKTLSGMEKIWVASLLLDKNYQPDVSPDRLPDDGLAKLLTNPWATLNPKAELPTDKPVTMLFLYTQTGGTGELDGTLIAESVTGTTFITVRESEPEMATEAISDRETVLPPFYQGLKSSEQSLEVVTVGKLAYAHYHLSDEETKIIAFRYAICRAPRFLTALLNEKAKNSGLDITFTVVNDGSFRVVYQTDSDSPTDGDKADRDNSNSPSPSDPPPPGPIGNPCFKLTGTINEKNFKIDSLMSVRYRVPPTTDPDPTPTPAPSPDPAPTTPAE